MSMSAARAEVLPALVEERPSPPPRTRGTGGDAFLAVVKAPPLRAAAGSGATASDASDATVSRESPVPASVVRRLGELQQYIMAELERHRLECDTAMETCWEELKAGLPLGETLDEYSELSSTSERGGASPAEGPRSGTSAISRSNIVSLGCELPPIVNSDSGGAGKKVISNGNHSPGVARDSALEEGCQQHKAPVMVEPTQNRSVKSLDIPNSPTPSAQHINSMSAQQVLSLSAQEAGAGPRGSATIAESNHAAHDSFLMLKGWHGSCDNLETLESARAWSNPSSHNEKGSFLLGSGAILCMCWTIAEHWTKLRARMASVVFHPMFDISVGLLIVLNAIVVFVEQEGNGMQSGITLGYWTDDPTQAVRDKVLKLSEAFFNIAFFMEIVVRVLAEGCRFFASSHNLFDVCLVLSGLLDSYLWPVVGLERSNLSVARLFRFARLVRILRITRVMRVFGALRILLKTMISSVASIAWSMIFLFVVIIINAIFLSSILKEFIQSPENDMEARRWVFRHYGSASRAVYTMFEVTLSGGWPNYARVLVESVSPWLSLFWVIYVMTVVFAVIRIITAIFLRETLKEADLDEDMLISENMKQTDSMKAKLREIFHEADTSGDGFISLKEFKAMIDDPRVVASLQVYQLNAHEANGLFHLLDDGDGRISMEEFLSGLVRLKGGARTVDMVSLLYENSKMAKRLHRVSSMLELLLTSSGLTVEQALMTGSHLDDMSHNTLTSLLDMDPEGNLAGSEAAPSPLHATSMRSANSNFSMPGVNHSSQGTTITTRRQLSRTATRDLADKVTSIS